MPDEPIESGQLPSDDDFEARFRKAHDDLKGIDVSADPLSADYEKRLRKALGAAEIPGFELSDELIALRAAQLTDEVAAAARPSPPDVPDIEARLAELDAQSKQARARNYDSAKNIDKQRRLDADAARGAGVGLSVASMFVGVPLLFAVVGLIIDHAAHGGGMIIAFMTLAGTIMGVYVGIVVLNRHQSGR